MDQTLLILMIVVSATSAIALCVQACMLFGIWKTSKATHEKLVVVIPKVEKFPVTRGAVDHMLPLCVFLDVLASRRSGRDSNACIPRRRGS